MTKQEEIREGIEGAIESVMDFDPLTLEWEVIDSKKATEAVRQYLHSKGVVIKVECPKCHGIGIFYRGEPIENRCVRCKGTGYVEVVPLV